MKEEKKLNGFGVPQVRRTSKACGSKRDRVLQNLYSWCLYFLLIQGLWNDITVGEF
jgi:hypothetical protein